MNSRTKGNDMLRKRLKNFLKTFKSGAEIRTNHVVMRLSKLNKNYSISSQRVTSLMKEHDNLVVFIKSGVWMKI
jgi:hypothetical protein